jgi:hypothetical protein
VLLSALSIVQYRRAVAELRPPEIPRGYWVNLALYVSGAMALLGLALSAYLIVAK